MESSTELASNFTVGRYHELRPLLDEGHPPSWDEVLRALRRRIHERFLKPMRDLARFDHCDELPNRPGFAILALDCLLIDTIQSFREGRVSTGEVSPAHSFKQFLSSQRFADFKSRDRGDFFQYVRNGILHNGESRKDWKVRIDTNRMLEHHQAVRTINRRLFHAAVTREWRALYHELRMGNTVARQNFLRRMDSMAGLPVTPYQHVYFAYGSNLLGSECRRTAPGAQDYGKAFLPGYRLSFAKHSITRKGDAATIAPDAAGMVWGYTYRLADEDKAHLTARECGYLELPAITVYLVEADDAPTPITAFTFTAIKECTQQCGPPEDYLALLIQGAHERHLPQDYREQLTKRR